MRLGATDQSGRRRPVPREGSQFTLVFDASISAVGEEPDRSLLPPSMKKRMVKSHRLGRGVYGAGDFVGGSSTVIEAVASGREAAGVIDEDLGGRGMPSGNAGSHGSSWARAAYEPSARVASTEASVTERLRGLSIEDRQGITADEARRQAGRCLKCGCAAVAPSDIGVALVAMGGKIVTTKRKIDASAFFAPDATASTVLDADEMITEILVPKIADRARQRYLKFTLRKPLDFAVISVGTIVTIENGSCSDARIALGAVAPAPFRASRAEQRLVGNPVNDETASVAAEAAVEGAMPLNKNGYKVQLTKALVKRAILGET
jgi:CO/xanthine dehydrogenase FAD-binding subunit